MLVHVTELDLFRKYKEDEDFPLEEFLRQLRGTTSPDLKRGIAFHKAMEKVSLGETDTLVADGHTFAFTCDAEIEAWPRREERRYKDYGGIIVTGASDRVMGRIVCDDKTTKRFDAESYIEKFQWRYYLDMFDADEFRWHVWETREIKEPDASILDPEKEVDVWGTHAWEVYAHHLLVQYRYEEIENDCRNLAQEFLEFATSIGWKGTARTD